jgi:hypothetical protein
VGLGAASQPLFGALFRCSQKRIACPVKKPIEPFSNVYYMLMDEHGHVIRRNIPVTRVNIGAVVPNLDFYLTISYIS